jgi:hypothetical protein
MIGALAANVFINERLNLPITAGQRNQRLSTSAIVGRTLHQI